MAAAAVAVPADKPARYRRAAREDKLARCGLAAEWRRRECRQAATRPEHKLTSDGPRAQRVRPARPQAHSERARLPPAARPAADPAPSATDPDLAAAHSVLAGFVSAHFELAGFAPAAPEPAARSAAHSA